MSFKITARTILQLGAELISSDAIAFYEVIKNAFDAGSPKVDVRIVQRIPYDLAVDLKDQLTKVTSKNYRNTFFPIKEAFLKNVDNNTPDAQSFYDDVKKCEDVDDLIDLLKNANFITFKDSGEGMSLSDLDEIYLTIGTRNRRKQKEINKSANRPILGEKGIGRLSVMRLGEGLIVESTEKNETHFNELKIDWSAFSNDSDSLLESIKIKPKRGRLKSNKNQHGTTIYIYDLTSQWSEEKLREISRSQLGRFVDPFQSKNRDFIALWYNTTAISLQGIDKTVFQYAHAKAKATLVFEKNGTPKYSGEIDYLSYNRNKTFSLDGTHLYSVLAKPHHVDILKRLGPFTVELYWYNRRLLTKGQIGIEANYIKTLVDAWGGGLMVYRDGFRVNPYGAPDDDWLNLDPKALGSPGYKLNRKQIIGKVEISSIDNPKLLDQTNREGLRDSSEKEMLISLLQYLIWDELKVFLDDIYRIENENIAALSLSEIEKRIDEGQKEVRQAIEYLKEKYPAIKKEAETLNTIEEVLKESDALFKTTKASSEALENRLKTTIELAGLGLMVDVIAHELKRSTESAIKTINSFSDKVPEGVTASMSTLRNQLKTLQARLKVIDPLGPSGRQQKATVDLKRLIIDTFESHKVQFSNHNIIYELIDGNAKEEWNTRVVPGMVVQIFENLINNSIYWIKQEQNVDRIKKGKITVRIDRKNNQIFFSDNGPGIPREKKADVFRPFYSTKPPGLGKGLGLYISQENARYHNASLSLADTDDNKNLNTFLLKLSDQ